MTRASISVHAINATRAATSKTEPWLAPPRSSANMPRKKGTVTLRMNETMVGLAGGNTSRTIAGLEHAEGQRSDRMTEKAPRRSYDRSVVRIVVTGSIGRAGHGSARLRHQGLASSCAFVIGHRHTLLLGCGSGIGVANAQPSSACNDVTGEAMSPGFRCIGAPLPSRLVHST